MTVHELYADHSPQAITFGGAVGTNVDEVVVVVVVVVVDEVVVVVVVVLVVVGGGVETSSGSW